MKINFISVRIILIVLLIVFIYAIWRFSLPVEVVAVHKDRYWTKVLVKNFPLTSRGKVDWWEKNKAVFKKKYGVPQPDQYGRYSLTFWDFGDGYEIEQPDKTTFFPSKSTDHLYCFKEMRVKAKCIRKDNWKMDINTTSQNLIRFNANGDTYYQDQKGTITKGERFVTTIN